MMRSDNLNWYDIGGYKKITAPYSNFNVTNENISKHSIISETLSHSCSTNEDKSKHSIVNKPLSQKFYPDGNECSTKEYKYNGLIRNKKTQRMRLHAMC